jgi:hypothetical protein
MNEREQIISFLLQLCDTKNRVLEAQQKQIADLQKQIDSLQGQQSQISAPQV